MGERICVSQCIPRQVWIRRVVKIVQLGAVHVGGESGSKGEGKRELPDLSINQAYESAPRMIEIQSCAPITSGNVDGGDDKWCLERRSFTLI